MNRVGDIVEARTIYLPHFCQINVRLESFFQLMQSLNNELTIDHLSKFSKIIFDTVC